MWGDFYAKGGSDSFVHNTSLGANVLNLYDYDATPADDSGNALSKILVPDTVPEPATVGLLALSGVALVRRVRRVG